MKDYITLPLTNDIIKRGLVIPSKTQGIGAKLLALALFSNEIHHSHITWNDVDGQVFINNKIYHVTAYNSYVEKVDVGMFEPTWGNAFCPREITLTFEEIN